MNTNFHKQMRKLGFDYSERGRYFVTICANDRKKLFGEVVEGKMILNGAGRMVESWYMKLFEKYPEVSNVIHTVMPNHFHSIIYHNGDTPQHHQRYGKIIGKATDSILKIDCRLT